jgi:hypothetical protein
MMTDRELMQTALDALESDCDATKFGASEALRARLTQPEPLPAKSKGALSHEENKQHNKKILDKFYEDNAHLYTAPPQREWQGLTDEEIENCFEMSMFGTCRAIEAKLREKNT